MAKIAAELERALARRPVEGTPGHVKVRVLAYGNDGTVSDVLCTSGPHDRPFEERHPQVFIAMVVAGYFQYRSTAGGDLLTPGSVMLGNANQPFECSHEHGLGDRCLSFGYAPDYFERIASDAGMRGPSRGFRALRLPPLRELSPLVAQARAGPAGSSEIAWEELSIQVAVRTTRLADGLSRDSHPADPEESGSGGGSRPISLPAYVRASHGCHAASIHSERVFAKRRCGWRPRRSGSST